MTVHTDDDVETNSVSGPVDWGVYTAAIRRWEAVLGRLTPHPSQSGNHGCPVLAPVFVEHLMGPEGWVTDLPLPRTAHLRALGNGVVTQQATRAVAPLLDDLTALLDITTDTHNDTERGPLTGLEATAA